MPRSVYVLGFAIFAQGTSELMLSGLLPSLSADLDVSVARAGLLVSGFALGMLVGAPALAIATVRWSRRRAMLLFLTVFSAAHVVGALTASYAVLFAARFVAAFVYAGFWAVATSTVVALVPADRRARAMGVVAGGLTVATVVGLPVGATLGEHFGWRGAFWAVAALSVVATVAVAVAVPDPPTTGRPDVLAELRALRTLRLWRSYALTAVSIAALMVTFSYLGAMVIAATGLSDGAVPIMLLLFGLGSFVGIVVGGRTADHRPLLTLAVGFVGMVVVSLVLSTTVRHPGAVAVSLVLLGALGFVTNPVLNSRVFGLAPGAPHLVSAVNVSAFNVGIAVGPWLGGLVLTAGAGYAAIPLVGAALALGAVAVLAIEVRSDLGRRPVPAGDRARPGVVTKC